MNIYQRLAEINKAITAIGKNQNNRQQGFKYRGVDDVMNELHGLFAKHEVLILPEIVNGFREERQSKSGSTLITSVCDYKYSFVAPDGSTCFAIIRGEGMDSGDKSNNKAIAVALKYVLTQMFLIPTDEMKDPDAESHDPKPKPEKEYIIPENVKAYQEQIDNSKTEMELEIIGKEIAKDKKLQPIDKVYLKTIYKQKQDKLK